MTFKNTISFKKIHTVDVGTNKQKIFGLIAYVSCFRTTHKTQRPLQKHYQGAPGHLKGLEIILFFRTVKHSA